MIWEGMSSFLRHIVDSIRIIIRPWIYGKFGQKCTSPNKFKLFQTENVSVQAFSWRALIFFPGDAHSKTPSHNNESADPSPFTSSKQYYGELLNWNFNSFFLFFLKRLSIWKMTSQPLEIIVLGAYFWEGAYSPFSKIIRHDQQISESLFKYMWSLTYTDKLKPRLLN